LGRDLGRAKGHMMEAGLYRRHGKEVRHSGGSCQRKEMGDGDSTASRWLGSLASVADPEQCGVGLAASDRQEDMLFILTDSW